jgi:type II secretory pathway pseudopilin PulG
MTHRRAESRGFVFVDVAMGLALLGVIAIALVSTVGRQQRAAQKLSDTRAAARLAEDALNSLRAAQPLSSEDGSTVGLARLPDPAPPGFAWVRATARVGTSQAQMVGLVPATVTVPSVEGGTP